MDTADDMDRALMPNYSIIHSLSPWRLEFTKLPFPHSTQHTYMGERVKTLLSTKSLFPLWVLPLRFLCTDHTTSRIPGFPSPRRMPVYQLAQAQSHALAGDPGGPRREEAALDCCLGSHKMRGSWDPRSMDLGLLAKQMEYGDIYLESS